MVGKSVKIEDSIHEWLLDHRNSKRRTISSVIKGLIDDSVDDSHTKPRAKSARESFNLTAHKQYV